MEHLPYNERRKHIVLAAMKAFARSGFKGTRTRDLADAAGVSEALIFKYFPHKRALQKAIIEERIRQTGTFLAPELAEASPGAALRAVAARIITRCGEDPNFMRLLFYSGLEREPLAPMFFRRRYAQSIGALASLFRRWVRRGLIRRSVDPRLTAWCFMACVFQLMASRHIFGVRRMMDRPGDLAEKVADLFLKGLRP